MQPINILPGRLAQAARWLQPVLLGGLFVARFRALVADPTAVLQGSLPVVAAIQSAYAMICLPAAGSKALITAILALVLTFLVTPAAHVVFVLFGAPAVASVAETFLLAAHLAVLALFPAFYVHGVSGGAWRVIGGGAAPIDEVFGGFVGGAVGAWLGAIPIPLDWDRDWQRWPVTMVAGAYAGYIVGKLLGGTAVGFGKRFAEMDVPGAKKKMAGGSKVKKSQ